MKRCTGMIIGLIVGVGAGGMLLGPLLQGQDAKNKSSAIPKELTSYRNVVKRVLPAVVSLDTEKKPSAELQVAQDQPLDEPEQPRTGFGSGFIVDPDGVVMTNYHVMRDVEKVVINLMDGRKFVSTKFFSDRKTDLSIIKFDTKGEKLPYLQFGDSSKMEIGDRVLAFGAPFGLRGSVTQGIISAKGRSGLKLNMYEDFLQTDAAINPGNSGGPLVNLEGKVIGLNAAIKSKSGGFDGVGLAVASNLASRIKDALVKDGRVRRGYIGLQVVELDDQVAAQLGLKKNTGVVVGTVFENTPAAKAGLKAGDIIIEIAGKTITNGKMLQDVVVDLPLDKATTVIIMRNNKKYSATVTIEELPSSFDLGTVPALQLPESQQKAESLDGLGVQIVDLTAELAKQLGYEANARGVVISKVAANSVAFTAGLRTGMLLVAIDNQPTDSVQTAQKILANASLTKGVLLQYRSLQGGTNYVVVKSGAN